jgi:hypothetical protein
VTWWGNVCQLRVNGVPILCRGLMVGVVVISYACMSGVRAGAGQSYEVWYAPFRG